MKIKHTPLHRGDQTRAHWRNQRPTRNMAFAMRTFTEADIQRARDRFAAEGGDPDVGHDIQLLQYALADIFAEEHPAGVWEHCPRGPIGSLVGNRIRFVAGDMVPLRGAAHS